MTEAELRDKDRAVLHAIHQSHNDTQKITSHTTLENHHVRYSLKKLSNKGLINLEKPDGMTERTIEGQKRVFQTPWQASLTDKGLNHLKKADKVEIEAYENMSHDELIDKVHQLENQITGLEKKMQMFQKQIIQKLE